MDWLSIGAIIVDIVVLAIIFGSAARGWKKGAATIIFELGCTLLAILLTIVIFRPVSNLLVENTGIDEYFSNGIYEVFEKQNLTDVQIIDPEKTNMASGIVELVNGYISEAISKSVSNIFKYVSDKLANMIVQLLTIVGLFVVVRLAMNIFKVLVDILAALPLIKQINEIGGCVIGLIKSVLVVYLILAIFTIVSPLIEETGIIGMIQDSKVASVMFNNNIIINIVSKGI